MNKLRKLLEEAAKGNFDKANNLISNDDTILNCNTATSVVIECCRIFTTNNNSFCIIVQDLLNLLTTCVKYIEKISEERSLSYVRSLFFILKYFFVKNNVEIMLQLVPFISADFIYYDNHELKKVYNSIWSLFHNAISKMSAIKESQKNDCFYFQMCLSAVQIYGIPFSNTTLLANLASSYCKSAKCYEADPNVQYNFYKQLLLTMKLLKTEKNDEFYIATMKVIEVGIKNFFRGCHFCKIGEYLTDYKMYIDDITEEKMYLKMGQVFYSAAQCITEINESSSSLHTKFEKCLNSVKFYFKSFFGRIQNSSVCNILACIFDNLVDYYSKVPCSVWVSHMEENTLVHIFKILACLAQAFTIGNFKCKFCNGSCDADSDLFHSVNTMILIGSLMRISIINEVKVSISMSNQVLYYLEHCCVQILTLKNKKCNCWVPAWREIGIMLYSIATKLYAIKHSETSKYFMLLMKHLLKLEGTHSEVFKIDALTIALKCLSDIYVEAYDYKKALMFIALMILLRPNLLTSSFKHWISIKVKEKQHETDSSLQELTVVCVLEQNRTEIINMYPHAEDYFNNTKQLLINELNHYQKIWPSRIPMLAVFKKIYKHCDLVTTVKTLVTTWDNNMLSVYNDVFELLTEIVHRFETEIVPLTEYKLENEIYLAQLYMLKYYAVVMEERKKNFKEIEISTKVLEGSQISNNNKCDVVPSYTNLKLNEYLKMVHYLKKALTLFDNCLSQSLTSQIIELLKECNVLNVLANIAFEFRLYCDSLQYVDAWFVCLKMSRVLKNTEFVLKSIGFLMENSCLHADVVQGFLTESEQLVGKLIQRNHNDTYETLTTFYTHQSIMYHNNQKFQAGFQCYEDAVRVFNKIPDVNQNEILKAQLDFLHVRYLQLPCNLQFDNHEVYSLQKFSQVCRNILTYMKDQGYISSYGLALLFEINCTLIHMYKWMLLPRQVRCYSRDLVVLAQQLVIPLRTGIILSYMAYSDLQSIRIDDCQVKIDGLSDILCLATNKHCTVKKNEIVCDKSRWENNDVAELTDNFAEILLDCPISTKEQALQGSPTLLKTFKLPFIFSHTAECDCFYCLSIEYQNLLITTMHLDAEHYVLMNNTTAANYCFGAALQLYHRFTSENNKFQVTVNKVISCYPFFNVKDMLCQSHCTVLLGYARHLFRHNDILKAKRIFKDLIHLISENMYINVYLYNEAHLEYAIILMDSLKVNELQQKSIENLVVTDNASNCAKTPESKQSKVVFYRSYSPNPESPPKRMIPKIKCDFSEVTETTKTTKTNKEKSTNVTSGVATPCCSSQLYAPPVIQTQRKKRNILIENLVFAPDVPTKNENNETILIPTSPNAYTPNALKAMVGLQSKTKLLTQKLKSETRRNRIVQDNDKEISDVKNNVCKNLMTELTAADKKCVNKKSEKKLNSVTNNTCVEQTKRVTRATARNRK
ncbi:hypothetical protein RN001_004999 [Aquatica leii]|uniref:Separase n=1 Tax=Aquatica leii TaxID=1421715 RepID=A0AAN7P614_9COLE|nr:hypothetical protein RN001_004999 [Aquatica leii]